MSIFQFNLLNVVKRYKLLELNEAKSTSLDISRRIDNDKKSINFPINNQKNSREDFNFTEYRKENASIKTNGKPPTPNGSILGNIHPTISQTYDGGMIHDSSKNSGEKSEHIDLFRATAPNLMIQYNL